MFPYERPRLIYLSLAIEALFTAHRTLIFETFSELLKSLWRSGGFVGTFGIRDNFISSFLLYFPANKLEYESLKNNIH